MQEGAMGLDNFDQTVIEESGTASDILSQFYNVEISQHSAKKYLAGIRLHLRHKAELPCDDVPISDMEELIIKGDGSQTTKRMVMLSESDKLDPPKIMLLMGYDPIQWELISCKTRRNYWDVSMKLRNDFTKKLGKSDGSWAETNVVSTEPHKETNHAYTVTISVKPIQAQITSSIVKQIFSGLQSPKLHKYKYVHDGCMLEIPMLDFHLGKLAWGKETGQDYDLNIAIDKYKKTITDIISRVKYYKIPIEKIVFPIGQDFYHFDTTTNTTTSGTQMDTDTRWKKMYKSGVELLIYAIEQLRAIAPVECMYVAGNHDKMLSYCATVTLNAYYKSIDSVTVDSSPTARKYIHYGKCLIGYSHGVEEGKRIQQLMQIEQPSAWANSLYREWHLGHLHKELVNEEGGIIIRRLSAITGTDAWHNEKGFIGAIQKTQAFIWDKNLGNMLIINSFGAGE